MTDRWHAPFFKRWVWVELDGEQFIFNPLTGKSHYVNNLSAAMLRHLAESGFSGKELCQCIGVVDVEECEKQVQQHLKMLAEVGLVELC